jgi:hypothetical protein
MGLSIRNLSEVFDSALIIIENAFMAVCPLPLARAQGSFLSTLLSTI